MNILITGATSGIGYQIACDYHHQGHHVYALGRNEEQLNQLASLGIHPLCADLCNQQQVNDALQELPPLQLVILAAGACQYHDYHQFDGASFAKVIEVNLLSLGYVLEAIWFKLDSPSQLALIGSLARYLPFTRSGAYTASKAGIWQLTQVLRTDFAPRNISVHCIEPGFVKTPMTEQNDFKMPWLMPVEQASKIIIRGLEKKHIHIAFPKQLHLLLWLVSKLPMKWQNFLCRQMAKRETS